MQNKILYIVITIILSFVIYVLFLNLKPKTPDKGQRTTTTYSVGQPQQFYKQGKDSITTTTKTFHNAVTLKPSADDSTYNFTSSDSSCKLSLNLKPDSTGMISLDYFLELTTKDLVRIDTIFLTRIDTLKIKDTITIKQDPPFYNTFLFGALTTALVVILLIHLIP